MKAKSNVRAIRLEIAGDALESVFDECDLYDREETGGRVIGHFTKDSGTLVVRALGVIEPGPNARRTSTSFFQDGDYQTEVFRRLEANDPSIEHLGNWHTHHVNGYPTLSAGDVTTYRRIVNHHLHNLDFFYALLVTKRNDGRTGLERYAVRHYLLFRGEATVHEIQPKDVRVTQGPRIWPKDVDASKPIPDLVSAEANAARGAVEVRARDQSVLGVLYPSIEPRLSRGTRTLFWKGLLPLIDGSVMPIRIIEINADGRLLYHPVVSNASEDVAELCETPFPSASHAIRALESQMNREIYEAARKR